MRHWILVYDSLQSLVIGNNPKSPNCYSVVGSLDCVYYSLSGPHCPSHELEVAGESDSLYNLRPVPSTDYNPSNGTELHETRHSHSVFTRNLGLLTWDLENKKSMDFKLKSNQNYILLTI